jgi:hypothetical protein
MAGLGPCVSAGPQRKLAPADDLLLDRARQPELGIVEYRSGVPESREPLARRLVPGRSMLPVSASSAKKARAVATPLAWASMPWPSTRHAGFCVAKRRAASTIVCAGMPVMSACHGWRILRGALAQLRSSCAPPVDEFAIPQLFFENHIDHRERSAASVPA